MNQGLICQNSELPLITLPIGKPPAIIADQSPYTQNRFWQFFTSQIENQNTREGYYRAILRFSDFLEQKGVPLNSATPTVIAAYRETLKADLSIASVRLHLSAIRSLFDYLVTGNTGLDFNPASAVKSPKLSRRKGTTTVLFEEEAHRFLDSIDTSSLVGLRNKAIISTMLYTWGRVSEVRLLKRKNYYQHGKRQFIEFEDDSAKNNKGIVLPVGHRLQDALDVYIEAAGITDGYLFRASYKNSGKLMDEPLTRRGMLAMIKRCSGEFHGIGCHSMRATGITSFLRNGGSKTRAQNMARHSSISTTDLYDRNEEDPTLDDVNLILPKKW